MANNEKKSPLTSAEEHQHNAKIPGTFAYQQKIAEEDNVALIKWLRDEGISFILKEQEKILKERYQEDEENRRLRLLKEERFLWEALEQIEVNKQAREKQLLLQKLEEAISNFLQKLISGIFEKIKWIDNAIKKIKEEIHELKDQSKLLREKIIHQIIEVFDKIEIKESQKENKRGYKDLVLGGLDHLLKTVKKGEYQSDGLVDGVRSIFKNSAKNHKEVALADHIFDNKISNVILDYNQPLKQKENRIDKLLETINHLEKAKQILGNKANQLQELKLTGKQKNPISTIKSIKDIEKSINENEISLNEKLKNLNKDSQKPASANDPQFTDSSPSAPRLGH